MSAYEKPTDTVGIKVRRLSHGRDLPLPAYATRGAAGMDLLAALAAPLRLEPGQRGLVPTGLSIALPAGYELQVRPRSGLALKHGIVLPNAPGTIAASESSTTITRFRVEVVRTTMAPSAV